MKIDRYFKIVPVVLFFSLIIFQPVFSQVNTKSLDKYFAQVCLTEQPFIKEPKTMGIDVARYGNNETVFSVFEGYKEIEGEEIEIFPLNKPSG